MGVILDIINLIEYKNEGVLYEDVLEFIDKQVKNIMLL